MGEDPEDLVGDPEDLGGGSLDLEMSERGNCSINLRQKRGVSNLKPFVSSYVI